jgi:NADH-quinone oxidoreductase subunit N
VTEISYLAIAPVAALTLGVVAVLMVDVTYKPRVGWLGGIAGISLLFGFVLGVAQWVSASDEPVIRFRGMVALDPFAAFGAVVLTVLGAVALLVAWPLILEQGRRAAEFIALVLLALTGMILMASSAHFIMLFLSLEVASISLYVLAGFSRDRSEANEASIKYFLLGSFASAVFLYGVALTYAATGSLSLHGTARFLADNLLLDSAALLAGIGLLIVGLAFKVSAAPFHMWAPDVYQGAASGVSGFMTAGAKVAGFAALARIAVTSYGPYIQDWAPAVGVIAAISVVVGTMLAIAQSDIKRMLAYSSIAHAGFILTGLVAGIEGVPYIWFYVVTYAFQVLGAFAVVSVVSGPAGTRSALTDYAGLAHRAPVLAGSLALLMFSMAGIPLTAGFLSKLYVFRAAVDAGYLWLVVLGAVASVAGLFFYLRVIVLMYMTPGGDEAPATGAVLRVGDSVRVALTGVAVVTLAFGIVPGPLLDVVTSALPF